MTTISQINKLGERLVQSATEADLVILESFRRSFAAPSRKVAEFVGLSTGLPVSERPGKQTKSIIAKLRRDRTRLSKMQDIAGCRVVVNDLDQQDFVISILAQGLPLVTIIDRRETPKFGYHAVHLVAVESGRTVEVQVRTISQDRWANIAESFAGSVGDDLKYGGGPAQLRDGLIDLGKAFYDEERAGQNLKRAKVPEVVKEQFKNALANSGLTQSDDELTHDATVDELKSYAALVKVSVNALIRLTEWEV